MLEVHLLTLFPEALEAYLQASILGRAQRAGVLRVHLLDFRRFATDRHQHVDDRPYGGGPGMVLKPEPIFAAVEWVEANFGPARRILLTPDGSPFTQSRARDFAQAERLLLLCGRYEGFDERIRLGLQWDEISIGDFVLCGGELPALCVLEAATRLLPGALGDEDSAASESFQDPRLLDHPHYTRPPEFRGMPVPEVLRSGDHPAVARWRAEQARRRTSERRPDLLDGRTPPDSSSPSPEA